MVTTASAPKGGPAPAPASSRAAWLTTRAAVLLVALLAVGAVAGIRVQDRLSRPATGDRHHLAYEGADECSYVMARVDGLLLRGSSDLSRPPVAAGDGTLVIRRVWDLSQSDGLGASGVLTLADGTALAMEGGTKGKVFFTLGCPIRR